MTDTPDLRDQIEDLVDRFAAEGPVTAGFTPALIAQALQVEVVAPALAADRADLRIRRNALADVLGLPVSDDERGGDFHTLVQRVADLLAAKDQENARLRDERLTLINARDELAPTRHARDLQFERAERLVRERDEAREENEQWRAAFGETALKHAHEVVADRERLRAALAGHLFDGESLSTREAIRSELIKQGAEAAREVERLRAELAEARVQRDWLLAEADDDVRTRYFSFNRHVPVPLSGLAGHATPDTTNLPCCAHPATVHSGDQCGYPECPCGKPVAYEDRCEPAAGSKPRRHEPFNPAGLYTEPTDPGGA